MGVLSLCRWFCSVGVSGQGPGCQRPKLHTSVGGADKQPTREAASLTAIRGTHGDRLHHLLHSRTTQDGKVYDQESLEPLFLPGSKLLTEGPSYTQAIALLDEFLKERADARIQDPLKRAVLQRDLWAVFSTTVPDAQEVVLFDLQRGQITSTERFEDLGEGALPEEQRARGASCRNGWCKACGGLPSSRK